MPTPDSLRPFVSSGIALALPPWFAVGFTVIAVLLLTGREKLHALARRVDEADRDVLWAFADGFSHIYERAMLTEQLRAQRDSVRELFFGAVDRLDELCESTTERMSEGLEAGVDGPGAVTVELTDREAEVFELMVTGATNQAIADRLVITEGTVKSHVKHILRKYGAVNRAQAIAWALKDR